MTVIVPADAAETAAVINAIVDYKGPVYVRLGRSKVPYVMPDDYKFAIGKAFVFQIGKDANIVAAGIMVDMAKKAAEILSQEGIDTGVINMSTIKPLDEETLLRVAKSSKIIVTAEEHSIIGGLGGAVCEFVSENCPVTVKRIGTRDTFGCSGNANALLDLHGITVGNIVDTIKTFFKK
jgi:transketolase